jgi:hypothetical protein
MILRSPVTKPLHEASWKRPAGNVDFRITQKFGCTGVAAEPKFGTCAHFHRGIDMGNGKCGAVVVAAADAEIQFEGILGNGEIIVVLDHGQGWGSSYGHLRRTIISKGAQVRKGQKIGEVGNTGMSIGCHLHFAVKSGLPANFTKAAFIPSTGDDIGTWEDPWPLLEQNQPEDDMPPLSAYLPGHSATVSKGFNIRSAPSLAADTVLRTTTSPETWAVVGKVKGASASGSDEWLCRWNGRWEYVHVSGAGAPVPPVADCTGAVADAVKPLQVELSRAQARISAASAALTQ